MKKMDERIRNGVLVPKHIDAKSIAYLKPITPFYGDFIETIETVDNRHKDKLQWMENIREKSRWTPRNIRLCALYAMGSIQTDTDKVDETVTDVLQNYGTIKQFLENTRDGGKKWELCRNLYNSDIPEKVANLMQKAQETNNPVEKQKIQMDALATLANRDIDTGKRLDEKWYLRTVKASFVFWLLGFDTMCLDKNIFKALPIEKFVEQRQLKSPETSVYNPYRKRGSQGKKRYSLHRHKSVHDMNHDYWCDRLQYNPPEYTGVMRHILGMIRDEIEGETHGHIAQILFNMGKDGDFTVHKELMTQLETK